MRVYLANQHRDRRRRGCIQNSSGGQRCARNTGFSGAFKAERGAFMNTTLRFAFNFSLNFAGVDNRL